MPPKAENYRGILRPCGKFAGLGKVNDTELDRLDREIRRGFKETCQSTADFGKALIMGTVKNLDIMGVTSEPLSIGEEILLGVRDQKAYRAGMLASDAIITALGIAQVILGVGEIIVSGAGDVGGGLLCASGVGAPEGVAVIVASTAITVEGVAEIGAGVALTAVGAKNIGGDIDEFKKAGSGEESTQKKIRQKVKVKYGKN